MSFTTLMYHEIREQSQLHPEHPSPIQVRQAYEDNLPSVLFVTMEHFKEQMAFLYQHKYQTLTLREVTDFYYNNCPLPEKSVLLTFDDCYQSIARYAYPLLKEYGFHATAFVVTGWLNEKKEPFLPEQSVCLTKEEVLAMSDVFEFANHTHHFHTRKDEAVSNMMLSSDQAFSDDLDACNADSLIQAKDVFAYPFGLFSDRNVDLLRRKGFHLAFTSNPGKNDGDTDPLLLYRNAIPYFMDLQAFRNTLGA